MNQDQSRRGYLTLIFIFFLISPLIIINKYSSSKYSLKDSLNSNARISKSGTMHKSVNFNFFWSDNYTQSTIINGGRSNINVHINFSLNKKINQKEIKSYSLKAHAKVNGNRLNGLIDIDYNISSIGYISEKKLKQKIRNKLQTHIIHKITK